MLRRMAYNLPSFFSPRNRLLLAVAAVFALPFAFQSEAESPPETPAAMPVQVKTLQAEELTLWNEFSGRLTAVDYVQVRPRASGAITAIKFEEGAMVKEGDELFTIDTRPYEAEAARAKAAVVSAQSQAKLAKVELDRAKALLGKQHVSQSIYDQRMSAQQVAWSAIGSAEAQLKQAQLNLEYAHVKAPIAGRIGRAEITVGNVVEAGANAPVLTTILADGKMYAEFDVDEQTYLRCRRHSQAEQKALSVEVTLSGDDVVYYGKLHSFDNKLDVNSGTIRARAILENTDGTMMPGMYAKVRLQSEQGSKLLLPEAAIGTDQSKKFVYVVNKKNQVEYREVTLGQQMKGSRVVTQGVAEGDRVVMSGLAMLRPQMDVVPMEQK